MSDQVLTYRGVSYVKEDPMTNYLLNERLKDATCRVREEARSTAHEES